jgi:hypothetical protein
MTSMLLKKKTFLVCEQPGNELIVIGCALPFYFKSA